MPEAALITSAGPLKFADAAEEARDEYAKGLLPERKEERSVPAVPGSDTRRMSASSQTWNHSWQACRQTRPETSEESMGSAQGPRS